jgi:preprotein translocase subunit SecG
VTPTTHPTHISAIIGTMSTATFVQAATASDVLNVIAAFAGGLFIAGALIWAVRLGMKVMDQELPHPRPEEQPHLPETGPVRELREMREPDEVPVPADKRERLMPYQLHHAQTRRGKDQHRKRWLPGSSGSFGSGGIGHT